jgi:hypothetical protein
VVKTERTMNSGQIDVCERGESTLCSMPAEHHTVHVDRSFSLPMRFVPQLSRQQRARATIIAATLRPSHSLAWEAVMTHACSTPCRGSYCTRCPT